MLPSHAFGKKPPKRTQLLFGGLLLTPTPKRQGYRAYINPEQNVLASSSIEVVIRKVPTGVLRLLRVKDGFTPKL